MPERSALTNTVPAVDVRDGTESVDELAELRLQVLRLRDELIGSEAKLGEARERLSRMADRSKRIEDLATLRVAHVENELAIGEMYRGQVELILASTTWRVGRAIVSPSFAIKRLLRGS